MATLASDDLSLEIRYRDFQHGWIQYEIFFRWQGEIVLNDAILKRQGEYWGARGRGGVLANEDEECCILPTLEKVLETNKPDYCETIEPDIVLAIYPEQYFPFLPSKLELVRESEEFKKAREERARLKDEQGVLPDDLIDLMLLVDTYNFKECRAYSGDGICLKMTVRRDQLEEFYLSLKAEYKEFRQRFRLDGPT